MKIVLLGNENILNVVLLDLVQNHTGIIYDHQFAVVGADPSLQHICEKYKILWYPSQPKTLSAIGKSLVLESGEQVSFDLLGISSAANRRPPAELKNQPNTMPVMPQAQWQHFLKSTSPQLVTISGSDLKTCESALTINDFYKILNEPSQVQIYSKNPFLENQDIKTKTLFTEKLEQENIPVLTTPPVNWGDFVLVCDNLEASNWLRNSDLECRHNFLLVDSQLQTSSPWVFACGESCFIAENNFYLASASSYRQAKILSANLRAKIHSEKMQTFKASTLKFEIISTGQQSAVIKYGYLIFGPSKIWFALKTLLERRFTNILNKL